MWHPDATGAKPRSASGATLLRCLSTVNALAVGLKLKRLRYALCIYFVPFMDHARLVEKMIPLFLDLSRVQEMADMLPTTEQVIDYVTQHPRCKSKEIAAHFQCSKKDINKPRDNYPGIYKIEAIQHDEFCHYVEQQEPEPKPKLKAKLKAKPKLNCVVCLEDIPSQFPVMFGCCSAVYCTQCAPRIMSCAVCRAPRENLMTLLRATGDMLKHDIRDMFKQNIIDAYPEFMTRIREAQENPPNIITNHLPWMIDRFLDFGDEEEEEA